MKENAQRWAKKCLELKNCRDGIDFQTEFVADLSKDSGYIPDIVKAGEMLHTLVDDKTKNIVTYRDQCFTSIYTGTKAPKPTVPWWQAKDDSVKAFVK